MWPAALTRYVTGKSKTRSLVWARAAGAARASAAATTGLLAPEIDRGGRFAARHREARDEHPRLGRLAGRADLAGVPFREPGQDIELPGAARSEEHTSELQSPMYLV